MNLNSLKKISGDASFRSFYRGKKSILVFCKKEKRINLEIYDAVNKILNKNNIIAPKLISHNYKKNFIEIEDFGNQTVFEILKKNKKKKNFFYKKTMKLLHKLQKIKNLKIKTFLGSSYKIPIYTKKKLLDEANLFIKWYLPYFVKGSKKKLLNEKLKKVFNSLLNKLYYKKNVFVHRDFHVSNLMYLKKNIGLIDSQDAQMGHIAYDLASLIDDVRFKNPGKFKAKILNEYLNKNKSLNRKKFKSDFEILSVLRNFKIIGIFSRLAKRDNKKKYLKLIPHSWELIHSRIYKNKTFEDLKIILDNYIQKGVRG